MSSLFERVAGFFRTMTEAERVQKALDDRLCPDCGAATLIGGPRGGASQNVACGTCFSEFNLLNYGGHLSLIDHMGKLSPSRAELYDISPAIIVAKVLPMWSKHCQHANSNEQVLSEPRQ